WMRADDESAGCDCEGERRYQREKMLEEGSSETEKSGAKLVHVLGRHPVRDSESGLPGDEMIHHAKIAVEEDEVAEPILEGRDLRCVEWPQLHSHHVGPGIARGDDRSAGIPLRLPPHGSVGFTPGEQYTCPGECTGDG